MRHRVDPFTMSMFEFSDVGDSVQLSACGLAIISYCRLNISLQHHNGICCCSPYVCPLNVYSKVRFHAAASKNSL